MMLQGQCIHTPRGSHSRGAAAAISRRPSGTAGDVATAASSQNKAWSDILLVFEDLLTKLKGEIALHGCSCALAAFSPLLHPELRAC